MNKRKREERLIKQFEINIPLMRNVINACKDVIEYQVFLSKVKTYIIIFLIIFCILITTFAKINII